MADLHPATHYFSSGQFEDSELVVGLVGAVGCDLSQVAVELGEFLRQFGYDVNILKISKLVIPAVTPIDVQNDEFHRISSLMDAGNEARRVSHNNSVLALGAASAISSFRSQNDRGENLVKARHAYIINSLKHPDEVKVLRHIYGDGFFLIGVYAAEEYRLAKLKDVKGMTAEQAQTLVKRDQDEDLPFGQKTRETFHIADYFFHLDDSEGKRQNSLSRFCDIVLGNPHVTPHFDEFAMYLAFASSLRSADLSRQVGAVVARDGDIISTGANDCPKFGGGLYMAAFDSNTGKVTDADRGRDHSRGVDSNAEQKEAIVQSVFDQVKPHLMADENVLLAAIRQSKIKDITEYGRVVHAEMEALLACSRNSNNCRGASLYTTAFPCHNCAKHIVAAGISRVVYVEPYPKSRALDFHDDSIVLGFGPSENKVTFEPFVGVGPRRFFDLFSMNHGSGYPLERKSGSEGIKLNWEREDGILRTPMLPWSYLQREQVASDQFIEYGEELNRVE